MNDCFKYYTLKLRTLSPTFVGSGKRISNNEFCFSKKNDTVSFIDMNKLIDNLVKRDEIDGRDRAVRFEQFMLENGKYSRTLDAFMYNIGMEMEERSRVTIYTVRNNGCFDNAHTLCDINCFMRNSSNRAYIPGSSIKGMLRTMLLQYLIKKNDHKPKSSDETDASEILKKEADSAENALINTLHHSDKYGDMLNSIMKGVIVSDSEFIDDSNFIVCKKYDVTSSSGRYRKLNVVRECLRQGVEVTFNVKIDKRWFKPKNVSGSFEEIFREMVVVFSRDYRQLYLSKFRLPNGSKNDISNPFVILGGESGYFGKNIIYALHGYEQGLEKTASLMKKNKIRCKVKKPDGSITWNWVPSNPNDMSLGVSPHMLKETKLGYLFYHMGLYCAEIERKQI